MDYVEDICSNHFGGFFQLLLLLVVYGAVLFKSADVLSEGSELLMFVPSIKDVVGSIVLPILGAVPDGAIVLFSGMGPIKEAQEQLNVGVGALAGSTIMLLTIPWFLSLWAGRVDVVNGSCDIPYKRSASKRLTNGWSLMNTGITVNPIIRKNAWMMLFTAFPCYLIIQIPAFIDGVQAGRVDPTLAKDEHVYAIIGLTLCTVLFCYYLYFQANNADTDAQFDQLLKAWLNGDKSQSVGGSLSAILCSELKGLRELKESTQKSNTGVPDRGLHATLMDASLQKSRTEDMTRLRTLIRPIFNKYDAAPKNNRLDKAEFRALMRDLNERPEEYLEDGVASMSAGEAVDELFNRWDTSRDNEIDFNEFCVKFYERTRDFALSSRSTSNSSLQIQAAAKESDIYEDVDGDGNDDEEEEEMPPEELLTNGQIDLWKLKKTAATSMFFGTLVVLVFSDPMVDVLAALGNFVGVAPFYVSFVLAPLASNASELVASMNYASKKTKSTITTSLSTLLGAANMNNTFCLAIFYALIVFRTGLKWTFSAETISIVGVQVIMFFFAYQKTMKLWTAFVVLSFFPLSIVLVAFLESPSVGML